MNSLTQAAAPDPHDKDPMLPVSRQFAETDKIRCILMTLALSTATLTAPDVLAALGPLLPAVKRSRTMSPGRNEYAKAPRPKLIIEGKQLEDAGLRIGKKVTVRYAPNLVLITVDEPGPDPEIDERYAKIESSRRVMWDIDEKMIYGYPLHVLHQYARQLDQETAIKEQQAPEQ